MFTGLNAGPGGAEPLSSSEPFLPTRGRALAAALLFVLYAALCLAAVASSAMLLDTLSRVAAGERVTREQLRLNDLRQSAVAAASVLVYVAALVSFLAWLHRAYRNLRALGNPEQAIDTTPGWAVGSFFIPFVNLYKPYKVVREVWDLSDPGVRTQDDLMFARPSGSPLVLGWWIVWLATNVAGFGAVRLMGGARSIDTLMGMTKFVIFSRALSTANALFTAFVVWRLHRRQEERSRNVNYSAQGPPPPPSFTPPQGAQP